MGFRGRCATIVLLLFPIHHVYANTNTKSKIHAVVPPLAEPSTLNDKVIYSRNKQKILEKILGKRNHAFPNEIKEGDISALEDFLRTRGQIFHYHEQIKISSVHPSSSTTAGNVSINVFGGPFISDQHGGRIFCKFGQVAVPGSFVSSRQIHCHTPPHAPGLYSIEITQNGQDYTESGHAFRFYHQCNIFSINPVSGPSTMGGTNIQVFGENFVNSTSFLCRFGTVEVPATFVDSTKIYCSAPPIKEDNLSRLTLSDQKHVDTTLNEQQLFPSSHAYPRYSGSIVSFEVTNNGQDYTSSGFMFLYQQDIQVIKLSRIQGPSHGGTPVFISGSNFGKTMSLR